MKILTILGARPQFIKAGSVSRAIASHNNQVASLESLVSSEDSKNQKLQTKNFELITEIIVHTGQHYDANMSDIFFDEMQIPKPNYFLGIGGKSHGAMTGQMIEKIEEVALKENPDWIMVYGDTNSTLAGAIVASKLHIKLAHIEAGLRSFNMKMPEEVNRILTDRVSTILFCPTDTAMKNLKAEGFPFSLTTNHQQLITNVGDVMQDGAMFYKSLAKIPEAVSSLWSLVSSEDSKKQNLQTINQKPKTKNYILCTIHRAENTDDETRLRSIFEALNEIAKEKQIILPLHPRTKKLLENLQTKNQKLLTKNLTIIDPVGYLEMVWLIDNCDLVMTDSGGLQKEAYFFEKQCITLRDETEWVELVECGANRLVGADKEKIVSSYQLLVSSENSKNDELKTKNQKLQTKNYELQTKNQNLQTNLYGGGKASENIIKELLRYEI
ncbi:UDP-N-acetylglucosamine 2-epimerase (non-hydrolyzing) [Arcobacter cryaerophilus gv. pseudocryaerophilus]|uniref:UDP-N-acetylglucosamine 2-epimerase (Non-hydrolyzing) n=3 Tax=Arcobacteraceae TaxID=2808963 RepID=A0AA96DUK7_9BACT|nr:UDP-N-acetylglucosamine 2-epimerase (non-hydrolyzing) [Arcobacter sp. AZ-2023]WNL36564.1 UDP-N-acetylglucosamine 2-epimerase (non-hydrolyzing) [Arcobacter sp. AZ-2023]WPD12280.1 UDP-N-acetylglucosamine 2-epimerase (non-hydrolyzing) [Arcobacter sp. DSM 115960]